MKTTTVALAKPSYTSGMPFAPGPSRIRAPSSLLPHTSLHVPRPPRGRLARGVPRGRWKLAPCARMFVHLPVVRAPALLPLEPP